MDFYSELDPQMLSLQYPEAYHKVLEKDWLCKRNKKPGSFPRGLAYLYGKELQSQREKHKWIKQRNDSKSLHPILALYEDTSPVRTKDTRSRNSLKQTSILGKGSRLITTNRSPIKKIYNQNDFANLQKGHERNEMLQPRPDLTIMVQPSKIDYAGWQNNGGVRLFIHRTHSVPVDPRDSIEVENNVETFINLEFDDVNLMTEEFQRDRGCLRRVSRKNLWYDLEVELYNPLTYTFDACIHEWQVKTMFRACKCLPHYYSELFDYWWNRNLRCNHHGLKCMALVNGMLFFNSFMKSMIQVFVS